MVAKADAYGMGFPCLVAMQDLVDAYAVAQVAEGVTLRKLGVKKPILVLSYDNTNVSEVKNYNLTACISSVSDIDDMDMYIACDTGMNRLGVKTIEELESVINMADITRIQGLYSHIFVNSNVNLQCQKAKFNRFISVANKYSDTFKCHFTSSTNSFDYMIDNCEYIRLGIGMYKDAFALTSKVLLTKKVYQGETIGYNGSYIAQSDMEIAIIEGGYADGFHRNYGNQYVIINAMKCPLVGVMSMDTFMVDITGYNVKPHMQVVICNNSDLSVSKLAEFWKVTDYEVLTGFKGRYNYEYYN